MKRNWTGLVALVLVAMMIIMLVVNRFIRKDQYIEKIKAIEAINNQLKNQMDSIGKAVTVRDKIILKQIDSAYYFIGVLNERKIITTGQINALKSRLDEEKARRQALIESLK